MREHQGPHPDDRALGDVLMMTLNRAADAAPPPPADLYRTVTRASARRRGGLAVTATAVAVLVLLSAAGLLKAVRADDHAPVRPATAEELWPDAVTTLPSTIGGRTYWVDAVRNDRSVVIHTFGTPGDSELRLVTGQHSRLLASYPQSPKIPTIISNVSANAVHLTWLVHRNGSPDQVWAMRWSDERPRLLAQVSDPRQTFSVSLVGDLVVFGPADDGIRTIPADGGTAKLLAFTAHSYDVYWPWLILNPVAPEALRTAPPQLWNVVTGQHWIADFHPTSRRDACGPVWCVGVGDRGYPVTTQHVDGSDRRTHDLESSWGGLTPLRNRYLPVFGHSIGNHTRMLQLLDLTGDRSVQLGYLSDDEGLLRVAVRNDVVAWPDHGGKSMHVLDLDRIR